MIELRNVSKAYGSHTVFRGVNAVFPDGGAFLLTGPSGCGKTTLLRLILGLEEPGGGSVSWSGSISREPGRPCRAGVVFQEDRLLEDATAAENIRFAVPEVPADRVRRELLKLLPEDALEDPVSSFSGGMRRRTAVVRACLSERPLLVLDEPFTGLDRESMKNTADYIRKASEGRTVILASHGTEFLGWLRRLRVAEDGLSGAL